MHVGTDITNDDITGIDSDTHLEIRRQFDDLFAVFSDAFLDLECSVNSANWVVLMGDWRAEESQNAVAKKLCDCAL